MTNFIPPHEIATPRLVLRRLRPDDRAEYIAAINDYQVAKWLAVVPFPYTQGDFDAWLDLSARLPFTYIIALDDRPIGTIGLSHARDGTVETFGYWLGRDHWGNGFATEAARALIAAAERAGIKQIDATYYVGNDRSGRVLAKLGFRPVGAMTTWSHTQSADVNAILMRLTLDSKETTRK